MNRLTTTVQNLRTIQKSQATMSRNWLIGTSTKFIFALTALSLGILIWRYPILPLEVPLWYAKPWGADRLAHPLWLFLLPIGSIFWYIVTTIVSVYVTHEYLIFTQILFLTSLLVSLLSCIALVKIIFLVS